MSEQISDDRWNQETWCLSGMSCPEDKQFVISSAFDRDEVTLSLSESKRLRNQLNKHIKACEKGNK